MRLPEPPLLLITDRAQARRPLSDILEEAFAAGCRWASLREKDLPIEEQIALAQSLKPVAQKFGAKLTLHGDASTAVAAGIDGVHLGAGSDVAAARELLGPRALIGLSIHGVSEIEQLTAAPDYLVVGPVFETASKPGYGPALRPAGLAEVITQSPMPGLAIGGITAGRVGEVLRAGAHGAAVMGGVMRASDVKEEIGGFLAALAAVRLQPRPR